MAPRQWAPRRRSEHGRVVRHADLRSRRPAVAAPLRVEVAFCVVKRSLGAAVLHTCHLNGVLSQIWCTLMVYHVLGSLRASVAEAAHWEEDEVSWELLMRRIGLYVQTPEKPSLRDWLVANALDLGVRKAGRRTRRLDALPLSVSAALRNTPITSPTHPSRGHTGRAA